MQKWALGRKKDNATTITTHLQGTHVPAGLEQRHLIISGLIFGGSLRGDGWRRAARFGLIRLHHQQVRVFLCAGGLLGCVGDYLRLVFFFYVFPFNLLSYLMNDSASASPINYINSYPTSSRQAFVKFLLDYNIKSSH